MLISYQDLVGPGLEVRPERSESTPHLRRSEADHPKEILTHSMV